MKIKMLRTIEIKYAIILLILLFGCENKIIIDEDCSKYVNEVYPLIKNDTSLTNNLPNYQKYILEKFNENSIKGLIREAYYLLYYSSHGYGKSIKFEKNSNGADLTVKCINKEDVLSNCKDYKISINNAEWEDFKKMIYEFNFWTEEDIRVNEGMLDGYSYLLEGNRPDAERCNRKVYKLIVRGSPEYDKIGALCDYILDYEERLEFSYNQRVKYN